MKRTWVLKLDGIGFELISYIYLVGDLRQFFFSSYLQSLFPQLIQMLIPSRIERYSRVIYRNMEEVIIV